MAKGRSGRGRRGTHATTNRFSPRISAVDLPLSNHSQYLTRLLKLSEIEDRRRWTPTPNVPHLFSGVPIRRYDVKARQETWINRGPHLSPIRIVGHDHPLAKQRSRKGSLRKIMREKVTFPNPTKTIICVRRKQRKEVLHALKFTGGAGRRRRRFRAPRRNFFSYVDC